MANLQLPAYLKPRATSLAKILGELGGGLLPPRISIRSNRFTLIDAAGNEKPWPSLELPIIIVDVNPNICKMYFGREYQPDDDQPPMCFSSNGVAPSSEASDPQSPTCAACQHNVRGSAVSKMSGAAIKACRDEKKLAVLIPGQGSMVYLLTITPGSAKNCSQYTARVLGGGADLWQVVTQLSFAPGVNGVLTFEPLTFVNEEQARLIESEEVTSKFDFVTGKLDRPRQAQLSGPLTPMGLLDQAAKQDRVAAIEQARRGEAAAHAQQQVAVAAAPAPAAQPTLEQLQAEIARLNAAQTNGAAPPAKRAPGRPKKEETVVGPGPIPATVFPQAEKALHEAQFRPSPMFGAPGSAPAPAKEEAPIPQFLRRAAAARDAGGPAQQSFANVGKEQGAFVASFGMVDNPPAPGADLQAALNKALNLPTG